MAKKAAKEITSRSLIRDIQAKEWTRVKDQPRSQRGTKAEVYERALKKIADKAQRSVKQIRDIESGKRPGKNLLQPLKQIKSGRRVTAPEKQEQKVKARTKAKAAEKRPEKPPRPTRAAKPPKGERPEKPETPEKGPEQPEKPEKGPEKPETPEEQPPAPDKDKPEMPELPPEPIPEEQAEVSQSAIDRAEATLNRLFEKGGNDKVVVYINAKGTGRSVTLGAHGGIRISSILNSPSIGDFLAVQASGQGYEIDWSDVFSIEFEEYY